MVRSADRRVQKYEGKIDADVSRSRILALKDTMVEQQSLRQSELATNEAEIKRVVEGQTTKVFGHQIPAYLNVGRQLFALSKKFSGTTFTEEGKLIMDKWFHKGLDKYIIQAIGKLYGITYLPS